MASVTRFEPARGIAFRYGRLYDNRDRQLAAFERAAGFSLPADFLEMLGDYCWAGFEGYYRVYRRHNQDVRWERLLLMKAADEHDWEPEHDTLRLLREKASLFYDADGLAVFPFGLAIAYGTFGAMGYLGFDARRGNKVVFVSDETDERIDVASTFREMMLGSRYVFRG